MDWTFKKFNTDLDVLNEEVREKAVAIARNLIEEEDVAEDDALKEGIKRAKEWYYDSEG